MGAKLSGSRSGEPGSDAREASDRSAEGENEIAKLLSGSRGSRRRERSDQTSDWWAGFCGRFKCVLWLTVDHMEHGTWNQGLGQAPTAQAGLSWCTSRVDYCRVDDRRFRWDGNYRVTVSEVRMCIYVCTYIHTKEE